MSGEATNFVRLACVRHAASVRPEPGSNSRLIFLLKITLSIIFFVFHYFFVLFLYRTLKGFLCCFIVYVRCPSERSFYSLTHLICVVKTFFSYFFRLFLANNLYSLSFIYLIVNCFFIIFRHYFSLISINNVKLLIAVFSRQL